MLCAVYIAEKINALNIKVLHLIQMIFMALLLSVSVVFIYFFNETYPVYLIILLVAVAAAFWWLWKNLERWRSLVLISVLVMAFINLELNTTFYPKLLTFQSPSEAAFYITEHNMDAGKVISYEVYGNSMSYYLDTIVPNYWDLGEIKKLEPGTLVYTNEEGLNEINKGNMDVQLIQTFHEYAVTRINLKFLNPETREETISKRFLIRLKPAAST